MTPPLDTNKGVKTLPEILGSVYGEAYKCGVGAKHPYSYRSVEAVTDEAQKAIAKELMGCLPEKPSNELTHMSIVEQHGFEQALDEVRARLTAFIGHKEK